MPQAAPIPASAGQFTGGSVTTAITAPDATAVTIKGNLAAGTAGADVILGSTATRTGTTNLVSFVNNATEKAAIDQTGKVLATESIGLSFLGDTDTGLNHPNADHATLCAGNAQIFGVRRESATNKIGFFSTVAAAPVAQQTVTGSKGSNAALTSLLTALAAYGLIVDSSS